MIKQVMNITDEPHQRHEILYEGESILLELRYLPAVECWIADFEFSDFKLNSIKLVSGADLMRGCPSNISFMVTTTRGIDPFTLGCFSSGRSKLFFVDRSKL